MSAVPRRSMPGSLAWSCSTLTLGGGGLGQVWGTTTREECIETVREAVLKHKINHLDLAPMYSNTRGGREAEHVIGEAFDGHLPDDVKVTTKCYLGNRPVEEVYSYIEKSLLESLRVMKLQCIDLLVLHSHIVPDGLADIVPEAKHSTPWGVYRNGWIPAVQNLKEKGLIKAWGITGIGLPNEVIRALQTEPRPDAVQCIANCLQSGGGLEWWRKTSAGAVTPQASPMDVIKVANTNGVTPLGIRAVQAGAITDAWDRSERLDPLDLADFSRAEPVRVIAKRRGVSTAFLGHQYSLSMPVATVILGIKNREELRECVDAANAGRLDASDMKEIDDAVIGVSASARAKL